MVTKAEELIPKKLVLNDGDSRFWISARKLHFKDSYVVQEDCFWTVYWGSALYRRQQHAGDASQYHSVPSLKALPCRKYSPHDLKFVS